LTSTNKIYSGLGKVDYHISDKHSVSATYFISPGSGILNDAPAAPNKRPLDDESICAVSGILGKLDLDPEFHLGERGAGWVFSLLPGFSRAQDSNQDPANFTLRGPPTTSIPARRTHCILDFRESPFRDSQAFSARAGLRLSARMESCKFWTTSRICTANTPSSLAEKS